MSWLYSRALVVGYLQATLSDGVQFAQLREKSQPDGFLLRGRTMECCLLSRYGMTFAPLTESRGEALLTWFLAGFPVKPIPAQLAEKTMQTISGRKCGGSWQMSLPGTYLPRTSQPKRLTLPVTTLRRWVTKSEPYPLPRKTWVRTMFGSGIGYLHTPTTKANYCAESMQKWPAARAFTTVFGKPSPTNHEWLMGWPLGWTDTQPLEMDKYQSWRSRHYAP